MARKSHERQCSEANVAAVLEAAQTSRSVSFTLTTFLALEANTQPSGNGLPERPTITGAAIDLRTLAVAPARVVEDTTALFLPRLARAFDGPRPQPLHWCWSQKAAAYTQVTRMGEWAVDCAFASAVLRMSDKQLLQTCSTSPDCEDDEFPERVRAVLRYILEDLSSVTAAAGSGSTVESPQHTGRHD